MPIPRVAELEEVLTPTFLSLVSSMYSAVLYSLGELKLHGAPDTAPNLDMARFNIGLLEILREKSVGNLSAEEARFLDDTIANAQAFLDKHTDGASPNAATS
ncbi:MAG TPA: DUF1844 domain-containing protein [bacterium]|nr:DUF1844 domain-containing protein [bacterium]